MFEQIKNLWASASQLWSQKLKPFLAYYFVSDLPLLVDESVIKELQTRAKTSGKGIGVGRLGPVGLGYRIAIVDPQELSPAQVEFYLQQIMDLDDTQARSPFAVLQKFLGSAFLLSMTGQPAEKMRNQVVKHMLPERFIERAAREVHDLMEQKKLQPFDELSLKPVITTYVRSVVAKELLGFDEAPQPSDILQKITDLSTQPVYLFFPFLATITLWKWLPDFLKDIKDVAERASHVREEYKEYVDQFLTAALKNPKLGNRPSLAQDYLRERGTMTVNDPALRALPGFMLATDALIKTIQRGTEMLSNDPVLWERLQKELSEDIGNSLATQEILRDQNSLLHRIYLESLRQGTPVETIFRYTRNGIPSLAIPAYSYIMFNLKDAVNNTQSSRTSLKSSSVFNPERFLDSQYQLNFGTFLPFGTGKRMCPAGKVRVAEFIFKLWIVEIVSNFQFIPNLPYSHRNFVFESEDPSFIWESTPTRVMRTLSDPEKYEYFPVDGENYHQFRHYQQPYWTSSDYEFHINIAPGGGYSDRTPSPSGPLSDPKDVRALSYKNRLKSALYRALQGIFPILASKDVWQIKVIDIDAQYRAVWEAIGQYEPAIENQTLQATQCEPMMRLCSGQIIVPVPSIDGETFQDTVARYGDILQQVGEKLRGREIKSVSTDYVKGVSSLKQYSSWVDRKNRNDGKLKEFVRTEILQKSVGFFAHIEPPKIQLNAQNNAAIAKSLSSPEACREEKELYSKPKWD